MNMHIAPEAILAASPAHTIPDAVVGGGFAVFRRNSIGRLRGTRCPYEHGSLESASAEAARMAALHPGTEYIVFEAVARHIVVQP
jgi:hypothetical protein